MSKYKFVKEDEIRLNGKLTNVYNVYETVEKCERQGITVVTDVSEVFVSKAYGKTKSQAEENFYNEMG